MKIYYLEDLEEIIKLPLKFNVTRASEFQVRTKFILLQLAWRGAVTKCSR